MGNPWWDQECFSWILERKKVISKFNNSPSLDNFIKVKRIIDLTKRKLRNKKKEKFIGFCHTLNRNSNISYVWNKFKKFTNNSKNFTK